MSTQPTESPHPSLSMKVTRTLLLIVIIGVSALIGYRFRGQESSGDRDPAHSHETTAKAPASATSPSPSPSETVPDDLLNPSSEYHALLEKNHLLLKGQRMAEIFSKNSAGKALSQVLTLIEFKNQLDTLEGKRVADQLTFLESQPGDTLEEVRTAVGNFEKEFTPERQFLIQYVGRLDIELSDRVDFLSKELIRNSDLEENTDFKMNAVVALTTLLRVDADQNTIETALKQILGPKTPYTTRMSMIAIYESKYPDQSTRIETDFGL